jgi:hypothetical protein
MMVSVLAPEGITVSDEVPDIVLSPDGRNVVFVGLDSSGVSHLWVRPLASPAARMLPGTEDAKIPFWRPDSREIGFFAGGTLKRVAVDGEGVQTLADASNPRGAAWGPGGDILFAPSASGPLMRVPASGGEARAITTLDTTRAEGGHRFPCFLPDGRHFLYVAIPGKDNVLDTRVGSLDGGPAPVVVSGLNGAVYSSTGHLVYNREGTIVAQPFDARARRVTGPAQPVRDLADVSASYSGSPVVTVSDAGALLQREPVRIDARIDVLDRAGRRLSTLDLPPGAYSGLRLSPDGSRLVMTRTRRGEPSVPLWLVDVVRGTSTRFTFDGRFEASPIWTPDGKRVIYGSDRSGGRDLYTRRADGAGGEDLLADVPNLFNDPRGVDPAGRTLVYRSLSGTTNEDIWTLALTGEPVARPLLATRFNELDPALSPDGRWIAYRSDESGRFEIYVQPFPAVDRKVRVSRRVRCRSRTRRCRGCSGAATGASSISSAATGSRSWRSTPNPATSRASARRARCSSCPRAASAPRCRRTASASTCASPTPSAGARCSTCS